MVGGLGGTDGYTGYIEPAELPHSITDVKYIDDMVVTTPLRVRRADGAR